MKTVLHSFSKAAWSRLAFAVLPVLLFLSTATIAQQKPADQMIANVAPAIPPPAEPGLQKGLSADKKTYVSNSGKVLKVGQMLVPYKIGDKANNMFNSIHPWFLGSPTTNEYMRGEKSGTPYKIIEFKTVNNVTYALFKFESVFKYAAAIEAGLNNDEITISEEPAGK